MNVSQIYDGEGEPRYHDQLELPLEYRPDEDDGKGL
jgi:hypothetical protein